MMSLGHEGSASVFSRKCAMDGKFANCFDTIPKLRALTATEFKLLITLIQRGGHVQLRDQLLRDVWEYDHEIDSRTVTHTCAVSAKSSAQSAGNIWIRFAVWVIVFWKTKS